MNTITHGHSNGERCGRNDCAGVVATHPVENCSCHIAPPCHACTSPRNFCPECGWEERDDRPFNDHIVNVDSKTGAYKSRELRPLDPTKVDWHSLEHTHFSMKKRGVYPPGASQEDVRKLVDGTFGGRFTEFGNGVFEFVAYTD